MPTRGFLLTVEGIEGSGKTTQIQRLAQHLRADARSVVLTKEPGGTPLADRIRAILLDPQEEGMDPMTELFLYAASRRQHVSDVIRPSLERGAVVLCDRFTDASLVYQGYGRQLEIDRIRSINEWATGGIYPDLTLIFDLPEAVGLDRARTRNAEEDMLKESRLEGEDLQFHRRVREGYLAVAKEEPERFVVIDAEPSPDQIFEQVLKVLAERAPRLHVRDSAPQ